MKARTRHSIGVLPAALLMTAIGGCGSETKKPATATVETTRATDPVVARAVIDAAPPVAKQPTPPQPDLATPEGSPSSWGDYCTSNAECAWDGACFPRACVGLSKVVAEECEESGPPPGECTCVAEQCTLKPAATARPASPQAGCATDKECAVDPGRAICHVVANPSGERLQGPLEVEGPYCTCDVGQGRCQYHYSEAVPCTSFRECGWDKEPRLRPVPAKAPRKKPVRPCEDGPVDSVCKGPEGDKRCHIVSWRC